MAGRTYTDAMRREYAELWQGMDIKPERQAVVAKAAKAVLDSKPVYEQVEAATGVPWWWIGITHRLEALGNFQCHLHNGDPLTARTRQVPKGRPVKGNPPFTWKMSACDALLSHDLDRVEEWSIPRAAFEFERYNGWGYRKPGKPASPYLWSMTDHYTRGKYVEDGKYSPSAVSAQCGAMAILSELMKIDPTVTPDADGLKDAEVFPKARDDGPPPPASVIQSTEVQAGGVSATLGGGATAVELSSAMQRSMTDGKFTLLEFCGQALASPYFWGALIVTLLGIYTVLRRRYRLLQNGM
jgi:lysozyme family protein